MSEHSNVLATLREAMRLFGLLRLFPSLVDMFRLCNVAVNMIKRVLALKYARRNRVRGLIRHHKLPPTINYYMLNDITEAF